MGALSSHSTPELVPPDIWLATLLEGLWKMKAPSNYGQPDARSCSRSQARLKTLSYSVPCCCVRARPLCRPPLSLSLSHTLSVRHCLLVSTATLYPRPVGGDDAIVFTRRKERKTKQNCRVTFCASHLIRHWLLACWWASTRLLQAPYSTQVAPKGRLQSPNLRRHIPSSSPRLVHPAANHRPFTSLPSLRHFGS